MLPEFSELIAALLKVLNRQIIQWLNRRYDLRENR